MVGTRSWSLGQSNSHLDCVLTHIQTKVLREGKLNLLCPFHRAHIFTQMAPFYTTRAPQKSLIKSSSANTLQWEQGWGPHRGSRDPCGDPSSARRTLAASPGTKERAAGHEVAASHRPAGSGGRSHGLSMLSQKQVLSAILVGNLSSEQPA